MSPPKRMVVDSNAYFRLAQSIHPLLNKHFGDDNFCLFVIKELQEEYNRSPRLNNAFPWVNSPEYVTNRTPFLAVKDEEAPEIRRAFEFIYRYARMVHNGISRVDVLCLAHAEQLGIPVVTDDTEMRLLAKDYNIKTLSSMELLKLMLDCSYIDMAKVREIVAYWEYLNDKPNKNFRLDYKRIFGEAPP